VNECSRPPFSSKALLKQLHWLPLHFKLATLTFKALQTGYLPYLTDLLQYHQPTRSLCSSSSHQLLIPHYSLSFAFRAFHFSAHGYGTPCMLAFANPSHFPFLNAIWRLSFQVSLYPPHSDPTSKAPWFFKRLRHYTSHLLTCLLTYLE